MNRQPADQRPARPPRASVLVLLVVLMFASPSAAADENGTTAKSNPTSEAFERNQIVPDLVENAPLETLKVTYPSGVEVELGNELTPTQVKDRPMLQWTTKPDTLYTVLMADPDAPSRSNPEMRSWKHWVVGNVLGTRVDQGTVLADYVGSGPPQGTGLHRYVFLVYQQPGNLTFDETVLSSRNPNRGKWSPEDFAIKYELRDPIAGNFYQAQYDDYVPELYASFTES
ncbi:protein D3-like [Anopheles darlingi]|uniref:protein D3-like n=1 Tax=Anopheles darlingi TaxID=43151 RepID=UPI0021004AE0|nr:protein D3-like [Anopheles darlingi]XP_049529583.1 protein D3-like [Anopheles darlingi]